MLILALCMAFANLSFNGTEREKHHYVFEGADTNSNIALKAFFSFYLILNSYVPLELIIMLEIAKSLATFFLQADAWLKKVEPQTKRIDSLKVQTTNLHEELADIQYVFCDKTGTITQNKLIFSCASIALER